MIDYIRRDHHHHHHHHHHHGTELNKQRGGGDGAGGVCPGDGGGIVYSRGSIDYTGSRTEIHCSLELLHHTGHWRGSAVEAVLLEDVHLLLGLESEGVDAGESVLRPRPRQEGQTRAQAAAQEAGGHRGGLGLAAWDNTVKSSEYKTL